MIYQQLGEPYRQPGGTMHFLKNVGSLFGFGGKNIVVDSGIGFHLVNGISKTYTADIDQLDGVRIDLIIITHAHADHFVGAIALTKRHPEAQVIFSRPVSLSGWINASDTLKIAQSNIKQALEHGRTPDPLLFDYDDMAEFFKRAVILEHPQWISPWKGWEIGFHNCGHQRGAMSVFILPPHGRPIYLTGDTSSHSVETTKGILVPSDEFLGDFLKKKGVILITEATNGARFYNDLTRDGEKAKLRAKVGEIRDRNGRLFNPCFAQDRAASLALFYAEIGIPSHVDGLAREFLRTYADPESIWCEDDIPFPLQDLMDKGLIFFFEEDKNAWEIAKAHRISADRGYDGCAQFSAIISPSATMEKGHAVSHAIEILPQGESACVFTGHIFSDTPSEKLVQMSDPTERIKRGHTIKLNNNGKVVPVDVRCDVMKVDWTGHDGAQALVERADFVAESGSDVIVIGHHGNDENRAGLQKGVEALGLQYLDGTYLKEYDL